MKDINSFQKILVQFLFRSSSEAENKRLHQELVKSDENLTAGRRWFFGHIKSCAKYSRKEWIHENYEDTLERIKRKNRKIQIIRAAASIILLIGLGSLAHYTGIFKNNTSWNTIVLNSGEQKNIELDDGTTVHIAPETTFRYPESFSDNKRLVHIEGEAFFEVTEKKDAPFIVKAPQTTIKVEGTSFNVKAYEEDPIEETILVEGKVSAYFKGNSSKTKHELSPNQKILLDKKSNKTFISEIDEAEKPKWMNGSLSFHDESFSKLAKRLERFHDVKISISDSAISNTRLNGQFENESITEILDAIKILTPFEYKYDKQSKTIHISALPNQQN
ncbi:MAG: FecR family protein [Marinilabilia sp.]